MYHFLTRSAIRLATSGTTIGKNNPLPTCWTTDFAFRLLLLFLLASTINFLYLRNLLLSFVESFMFCFTVFFAISHIALQNCSSLANSFSNIFREVADFSWLMSSNFGNCALNDWLILADKQQLERCHLYQAKYLFLAFAFHYNSAKHLSLRIRMVLKLHRRKTHKSDPALPVFLEIVVFPKS